MNSVVILEWTFSPPDYFESRREIEQDDYTMIIAEGKVEVKMDSAVYDANPLIRNSLHEELKRRFLGVQLCNHKPYELSNPPTPNRLYPDGHRVLELSGSCVSVSSANVEYQILRDGIIAADSRQDRIQKGKNLADLFIKHQKDGVLTFLLESYNASVNDPNDELVHLYDIREALSRKFGGSDERARSKLGISKKQWSNFGALCNHAPFRQRRHRGNHETLRDATYAEMSEARGTAKTMIEAYLMYLDITTTSVRP